MRRRDFILGLSITTVSAPLAAQQGKVWRVGWLWPAAGPDSGYDAFVRQLRELGYFEGQNISIERRSEGTADQLAEAAAEIVRLKVDVIVSVATSGSFAAKHATTTIPIVMLAVSDPVATGLVDSYGRPSGNLTGLTVSGRELSGKRLEILKELLPTISRVAVLLNPANPANVAHWEEMQAAAQSLGLTLTRADFRAAAEIETTFAVMDKDKSQALVVSADPRIYAERERIADLSAKHRLPDISMLRAHAAAGSLMSYGPDYYDLYRRAAIHVDKILKGAKPADLPIEEPTKFQLVINLKTAKGLGLTIPPSLLARADEVIE